MELSVLNRRPLNTRAPVRIRAAQEARAPEPPRQELTFGPPLPRCRAWRWHSDGADAEPCIVLAFGLDGLPGRGPDADRAGDSRLVMLPAPDHVFRPDELEAVTDALLSVLGKAPRADRQRFLTTVLVTDIVGSTHVATRIGDRRWRQVLGEHYAESRARIEDRGGALVKTTGDGIAAIFDSPARAVRAGMAIQAAARASGLAVRAGVHAGECERLDDDVAGVAVHIAARVCALANADEVVTTRTVRDLVTGSMLAFEPRGELEVKGAPGIWAVFKASDPA